MDFLTFLILGKINDMKLRLTLLTYCLFCVGIFSHAQEPKKKPAKPKVDYDVAPPVIVTATQKSHRKPPPPPPVNVNRHPLPPPKVKVVHFAPPKVVKDPVKPPKLPKVILPPKPEKLPVA